MRFPRSFPTISSSVALSFVAAVLTTGSLMAAEPTVRVAQGDVAQWSAPGTESCGMDGRIWQAIEETCFFPVDMAREPGHVEIARWRDGGPIETGWLIVEEKEFALQSIDFPDDSYVNLSEEDLARHYREQAVIKPLFRRRSGEPRFTLPLAKPTEPLPEAKGFGVQREFNGEPKNRHTGADYAIPLGTPVRAPADGKVVIVGEHFFGGNSVYIYHGDGLVTMFLHLSEFSVEEGQEVQRGDEIAKVGSTGRSTGPHLHLGVRWNGARVDPQLLLEPVENLPAVEE